MKHIGIIIVNYKDYAERFLKDCIESLRGQGSPDFLLSVYIIDNCSSENSVKYIKEQAPEAVVIPREDGNYSAANRTGIEQAKKDGCDYFVIANMDVQFKGGWLKELVKAVESSPEIGLAQSKILLYPRTPDEQKKPKVNSLGNILHFLGFGFTEGYEKKEIKEIGEIKPAFSRDSWDSAGKEIKGYASGCSMIIKRAVIEKVGNYDPKYYMYHDDIELCWRSKLAGYKIVLAPKSVVYHKYEFSRSVKMLYYMERNRYFVIFSFYRLPTLLLILPPLIAMDLGMLFHSILSGWVWTKLKVYWYFLRPSSWKHIRKVRQEVKKFRVVKDREIVQNISGKVEYQEIMNPVLKFIVNPLFDVYWKFVRKLIFW